MRSVKRQQARWLAGGAIAGAAITIGLIAAFGGFSAAGRPHRESPVLAIGVAPVKGGEVVAYLHDIPANLKQGQSYRLPLVATAPIDASGHFVIRADPRLRPIARDLAKNGGFVNIELEEHGADGKEAVTGFPRTWAHGHWTGDPGLEVSRKSAVVLRR